MSAYEPITILMVDETPGKLLTYEAMLSELGEHLLKAGSAREALTHLLHTDIALILIDVNMPERDGFALARLIRAYSHYRQTAIIFLSAERLTHRDQLKGYAHGAVDYITAPIIPELLRAKVRMFADLHRKTVALQRAMAERQRLEHAARRAEHLALLGRQAAGVSHEIRNPLGAIFLHVAVLEEELRAPSPDSAAAVAEALAEVKINLRRLDTLVQDYLTLARVTSRQRQVQDLGDAVQTWGREMQREVGARGVTLQLQGLAGLGLVAFHASTLRRALLNLVQNAADAMPQGGTVALAGQRTATHIQLRVQDTGSGIPAEDLGEIFEPLYTTKPSGTGLGLYIVQEIIVAHEGQVSVESVVGQGTTFTLTLPRAVERSTSEDRDDDELSDSPGGK
jgi:signal transduction histidine kinase